MAAEMNPRSLDETLRTASDDMDGRLRVIQTLARSRVHIVTDKSWDGRSQPDRTMRIAMVSDGANQQQAMTAVFSNRGQAEGYLSGLAGVQHPFHNIAEVQMTWVLLGIPAGVGIMLNPNVPPSFRIAPEVAGELRRSAEAGFAAAQATRNAPPIQSELRDEPVNPLLLKVQQAIEVGDIEAAERGIEELAKSGINEEYVISSRALVAKYRSDFPTALELLKRAIAITHDPRLAAEFWWVVAQVCEESRDLDQAEYAYQQAHLSDPKNISYEMDLARFKAGQFKVEEALQMLHDLMRRQPGDSAPAVFLGNVLMDAGRHEEGLKALDEAIARFPQAAGAHFNRGVCLQMLGRMDEARAAIEKALTLDPALDGHQQYANLRKHTQDDVKPGSVYLQLLQHRTGEDMPMSTRIDSSFALSKLYDAAGDLDRSFEYLKQANALKRSTLKWKMEDTYKDVDRLIGHVDAAFIERYRGKAASKLAPIFVLGMPRSGTTLTEQILAAHSQVTPGGELTYLSSAVDMAANAWQKDGPAALKDEARVTADLQAIAARYAELTKPLQVAGTRFTDKMPGNFLNIGYIYLLFPDAKVIHCHRNPVDNCLSCYERLFSKGLLFSYDMRDLAAYYKHYLGIMQTWREILPKGFILDVEYEKVVAEPEQQIHRLLEFCDLGFEEACMNFHEVKRTVTTASSLQVRQPLYKSSVARWKKYGDRLAPLLEALGPELTGGAG